MRSGWKPSYFLYLGAVLVVLGFLFPFLMVMGFIESTFFLNFLAYILSTAGLILGVVGMAMIISINRKK